jgi:hypothetical protein
VSEAQEFERLLHIGLGRAILFAQQNDLSPYRDLILHACLHNTARVKDEFAAHRSSTH